MVDSTEQIAALRQRVIELEELLLLLLLVNAAKEVISHPPAEDDLERFDRRTELLQQQYADVASAFGAAADKVARRVSMEMQSPKWLSLLHDLGKLPGEGNGP